MTEGVDVIVITLLGYYMFSLLFLSFVGFWAARLLLPRGMRRHAALIAPLLGYCIVAIASSFLSSTVMNMTEATYLIVVAAGVFNLLAIYKAGWPKLPDRKNEQWPVALVALGAYAVGVLPLVHAGSTAFVGQQWDLELYLPIVEYLKRYVIGDALVAPNNPLLAAMNTAPFRGGSGWGFSYSQAAVDVLLGWMSYESFRPALQFVVALSIPSVYVFARNTLHGSHKVALTATVLWSMNGLTSWVAASGLAGHAISFATIPLALSLTASALTSLRGGAVVAAAISVAGMLLSYYTGALLVYVVGVAAICLPPFFSSPRRLPRRAMALGAIVCLVAGVGLVGHMRFLEVATVYRLHGFSAGWGVARYVPLGEALGLVPDGFLLARTSPSPFLGPTLLQLLDVLTFLMTQAAIILCLLATFVKGWYRVRFLHLWFSFVLLAFYMRFAMSYPYGYFKVLSLTAFLLPIGLAHGAWWLWDKEAPVDTFRPLLTQTSGRVFRLWKGLPLGRIAVTAAGFLFVALLSLNMFLTVRFFWKGADPVRPGVWELAALHRYLPPGQPVRIAGNGDFTPQENAMLAYFLIDNPIVGAVTTAYGSLVAEPGDSQPRYLIAPAVSRGIPPTDQPLRLLWSNRLVALYEVDVAAVTSPPWETSAPSTTPTTT